MADQLVELHCTISEDYSCQIWWVSDYGDPMQVADPVLMDVRDGNNMIAMRFSTTNDPTVAPYISFSGPNGFFQLTAPSTITRQLLPGIYLFDLFATVIDSSIVEFPSGQLRPVFAGRFVVDPRTTKIEEASLPILSPNPGG